MNDVIKKENDVNIVLCGAAGLGIQTVELLLVKVLQKAGYNVFASKEYMSRVRGGLNSTEIRISNKRVRAFKNTIDLFFIFSKGAVKRHQDRITNETIIFGDLSIIGESIDKSKYRFINVPLNEEAQKIGNKVYTNSIAAGIIIGLLDVEINILDDFFAERFVSKGIEIIKNNQEAARIGYTFAQKMEKNGELEFKVEANPNILNEILLSGTEAVGIGALAGGCNFVSAYPMSPSTGVFTFLAKTRGPT